MRHVGYWSYIASNETVIIGLGTCIGLGVKWQHISYKLYAIFKFVVCFKES